MSLRLLCFLLTSVLADDGEVSHRVTTSPPPFIKGTNLHILDEDTAKPCIEPQLTGPSLSVSPLSHQPLTARTAEEKEEKKRKEKGEKKRKNNLLATGEGDKAKKRKEDQDEETKDEKGRSEPRGEDLGKLVNSGWHCCLPLETWVSKPSQPTASLAESDVEPAGDRSRKRWTNRHTEDTLSS
ncbi:uncharacterized protein LY79DRAFT_263508 [Colletotrichum navitas]|uniref:Uncharacterized protein n=1 Tax=Colletotrichum navitas TaxID=681940 RepID=A0AAD8PWB8_9PEZI|nr:uncharacterized protein LY79DRAFT_263508 [Colletotrichum navitas]KAK1585687.1 hypothetical protein LY79DRAFT_263508 [Colletotrichum navitas]